MALSQPEYFLVIVGRDFPAIRLNSRAGGSPYIFGQYADMFKSPSSPVFKGKILFPSVSVMRLTPQP